MVPSGLELNATKKVAFHSDGTSNKYRQSLEEITGAEAYQESGLRPDRDEASRRTCRTGSLQRQGCGGFVRHAAGSASQDSAAAGESGAVGVAPRDQRGVCA